MHRSSEHIGAIAAALAKAQAELTNPEKTLTATIRSLFPREENRTFRYASVGLGPGHCPEDPKPAGDRDDPDHPRPSRSHGPGPPHHPARPTPPANGSRRTSPVCATKDVEAPHRMGAASDLRPPLLLFALVGIAGEDDLDAPDAITEPPAATEPQTASESKGKPTKGILNRPPVLSPERSAELLKRLLGELASSREENDSLLDWARASLPFKTRFLRPTLAFSRQPTKRGLRKQPLRSRLLQNNSRPD